MKRSVTIKIVIAALIFITTVLEAEGKLNIDALKIMPETIEVGQSAVITCYASNGDKTKLAYKYKPTGGKITATSVDGVAGFKAAGKIGSFDIAVEVSDGVEKVSGIVSVDIVPKGESSPWANVLFTVDTNTLNGIYVDSSHPAEKFKGPLKIKGELTLDEGSGEAQAGGSWPSYTMYDDGTHGDKKSGDGIWSLSMKFEKSDRKVHFAFDDASDYRVGFESGVTKTLKDNWIVLDEFPTDNINPAFVPDSNKEVAWDMAKAAASDSMINETPLQIESDAGGILLKWEDYASFYGKKAELYEVYMEGPFDTAQNDVKFGSLLTKSAETGYKIPADKLVKGKNYYFMVRGKYKGKSFDGKQVNIIY